MCTVLLPPGGYPIGCVYMCTVLLPPGGYPIAVKYISYHDSGLPSHSLNPGVCPCSQQESYLLQLGLPATQVLLIMDINICKVVIRKSGEEGNIILLNLRFL